MVFLSGCAQYFVHEDKVYALDPTGRMTTWQDDRNVEINDAELVRKIRSGQAYDTENDAESAIISRRYHEKVLQKERNRAVKDVAPGAVTAAIEATESRGD